MDATPLHLLLVHVLLVGALATLIVAGAVLRFHAWSQKRMLIIQRDAETLAMEFARYVSGGLSGKALRAITGAVDPQVLWEALSAFSNNIGGKEWDILSAESKDLPGVAHEIAMLGHRTAWRRALAASHLGLINVPDAAEPLRAAMARGPAEVTLAAALSLARMGDLPALVWLLEHPESTADYGRYQLVALLKRYNPWPYSELRRVLRADQIDMPIHHAAIEVLGLFRDHRSRRRLEALLLASSFETRVVAARALGRIGSPRSIPALQDALGDPAWQVRAQAARALGEIGATEVGPRLAACLGDLSWWVRRNSAYALAELGPAGQAILANGAAGSQDRYARSMCAEALQALEWEQENPGGIARVE